MLFGKYVLLPLFGHTLFGWLAYPVKNVHNFVGPLFAVVAPGSVRHFRAGQPADAGRPEMADPAGRPARQGTAHAGRFNGGEKVWFWIGVIVFGLIVGRIRAGAQHAGARHRLHSRR